MKLILDKNFIQETEKIEKKHKNAITYKGWTLDGEEIELVDLENTKIAPIVRYLAEGKKKKLGWLLMLGAGFLLIFFFVLMIWFFNSKKAPVVVQPKVINQIPLVPENKKDIEIIKTEKENETSWSLELFNEVDMMKDMKNSAELEAVKMNYEVERLKIELSEKQKENEKLTTMVKNLENELYTLDTRKIESATDEFIYYLGDETYKRCKQPTTEVMIEKCKTLYFNFLEYGKNR